MQGRCTVSCAEDHRRHQDDARVSEHHRSIATAAGLRFRSSVYVRLQLRCTMFRTAGRTLARALYTSVADSPGSFRAGGALTRWFNASGCNFSGHGQLDEFGIATGAEREELEWKRQGKKRFDLEPPRGPFGTKEAPAIVESHYDVRIVGCSGGVGEDEHDVTWFHLEKGQTHECPVCTQVFELKVIGVGGQPGHDEHH